MTPAVGFKEAMDSYFATKNDLNDLSKAITTGAGSAQDLQPIEYDAEILSLLVKKAPFIARLRALGKIKPARSSIVAYRRKATGGLSGFIAEDGAITAPTDSTWDSHTALMKVLITPIEISDMAQLGAQDVTDIYAQEIADGMIDQDFTKNKQIIQGAAGANAWDGLTNLVTTNTQNMSGDPIGRAELRTACNALIKVGGTPTAILTTPEVSGQLEDELYPGIRQVNQTELVTGINVTAFRAPNGTDIPIITDPSVINADGGRELYVLDETVLEVRDLMAATPIPLAKTKLTTSTVLAQFTTFFTRAQQWQYKFYNID